MFLGLIICVVLAVEFFFIIRCFFRLREILQRSTYTCRTRGTVTARKHIKTASSSVYKSELLTYRYTVRFLADEQEYTFRFERADTDGHVPVGKRIVVFYPEGKPSAAYAQLETDAFRKQCRLTAMHIVLLGLTAFGSCAISELYPKSQGALFLRGSLILWIAACLLFAAFVIWERICMRTQSEKTTGIILYSGSKCARGSATRWQTVRYTVSNQTYTFTQAQSGWTAKSYRKGEHIPIRYLRQAPFAAECADRVEWLRWWSVFFALFFPALMLFWHLTGA